MKRDRKKTQINYKTLMGELLTCWSGGVPRVRLAVPAIVLTILTAFSFDGFT